MKKIVILLCLFLGIALNSVALDLGIGPSIHYEPTAARFEQGINEWTYTQDIASFGIMADILVNDIVKIRLTERVIMGSNDSGSNIMPIGQHFNTKIYFYNDNVTLNYEFESYWQSEDVSLLYQMSIAPVHRLSLDINCSIFNVNLF